MEFDKSRVYTALNADELKVGSKIIVADNMKYLKEAVEAADVCILQNIATEYSTFRFIAEDNGEAYALAYLVEENKLKWTDLKIGDVITRDDTTALVIQIDAHDDSRYHIRAGDMWIADTILEEWKRVE